MNLTLLSSTAVSPANPEVLDRGKDSWVDSLYRIEGLLYPLFLRETVLRSSAAGAPPGENCRIALLTVIGASRCCGGQVFARADRKNGAVCCQDCGGEELASWLHTPLNLLEANGEDIYGFAHRIGALVASEAQGFAWNSQLAVRPLWRSLESLKKERLRGRTVI